MHLLLILDLDETLIYAEERPATHPSDFRVGPYSVTRRPGLRQFLDFCHTHFQLAVWTTAGAVEQRVDAGGVRKIVLAPRKGRATGLYSRRRIFAG